MNGITGIKLPSIKVTDFKWVNRELVEVEREVEFHERSDGIICCDSLAVDYWGENGDPLWVHPDLDKWAEENGYYWEWETPENIKLYNA